MTTPALISRAGGAYRGQVRDSLRPALRSSVRSAVPALRWFFGPRHRSTAGDAALRVAVADQHALTAMLLSR